MRCNSGTRVRAGWRRTAGRALLVGCGPLVLCGCTSLSEWVHNGFKVGPNYCPPAPALPDRWVDADNPRVRPGNPDIASWWDVFGDPVLTRLIHEAAGQNLTVREAGLQIERAQIQRNIAATELLPQAQSLVASYSHGEISRNNGASPVGGPSFGTALSPSASAQGVSTPSAPIAGVSTPLTPAGTLNTPTSPPLTAGSAGTAGGGVPSGSSRFFNNFGVSANLSWELDFWGLFRRNLEAADASLDQNMQNRDEIMVQLLANVATNYVEYRTLQKRLELARQNVRLQEPLVAKLEQQFKAGIASSKPAYYQLKSNLDNTKALIPPLESSLRQVNNQLCVLLGRPVVDLAPDLGDGLGTDPKDHAKKMVLIPRSREDAVVVGIPGDVLLRRPDVLAAERQLQIQSAQIGIAEAEMFPHMGINGNIGLAANRFGQLFNQQSWIGTIGPSLTWNILNYGRLLANVRSQDVQYQSDVLEYQQTLLNADQDAENALVAYLQSLDQSRYLTSSANDAVQVTNYYYTQLAEGYLPPAATSLSFYNQIFTAVNFQVAQQDAAAQAEGNIALNLILIYRALGGGWQIGHNHDGGGAVACGGGGPADPAPPVPVDTPAGAAAPKPAGTAAPETLPLPLLAPTTATTGTGAAPAAKPGR